MLMCLGACGTDRSGSETGEGYIEVDLDKSNSEELLRYYVGSYVGPEGGDPFEAGLLVEQNGRYLMDVAAMEARDPSLGPAVRAAAGADDRIHWDAFEAFLLDTYYTARGVPPTVEAFRETTPYEGDSEDWFKVTLNGVMTTARRHVYIRKEALRYALRHYHEHGERLLYPAGTVFIGEHVEDGDRLETTIMLKRADGFWDYVTYSPDGTLAPATQPRPRPLKTPTQCVGCHFGSKLFEPERSFPAEAPPGPHGPRALYVDDALRDAEVVRFFDEHRKRSDHVLGLYNTLFVAQLRAQQQAGTLPPEDAALLEALGL